MFARAGFVLSLSLLVTACQSKAHSRAASVAAADAATQPQATDAGPSPRAKEAIPAPADVGAPPADAERMNIGIASKILRVGTGDEHPRAWDQVTISYTGWTTEGEMVESTLLTRQNGKPPGPVTLTLDTVMPGWRGGIPLMTVGETRRFWIPEEYAYDRLGRKKGMLVFDIELLSVKRMPDLPEAPTNLKQAPRDAKKTPSGLVTKVLKKGTGKVKAQKDDIVRIHFTGWTPEGRVFDSSVMRDKPASITIENAIKGWREALTMMTLGEQRRVWVPRELGYDEQHPNGPQSAVVFDLELLEILTPRAPRDVTGPPAHAERTASGLAFEVLRPGTGGEHPKSNSVVRVDYSGWTTDGKMFDSSVKRGMAAEFALDRVIEGWTEGLQLMTVGEKRRLWVPEELAYKGEQEPRGMLVFDVELLAIVR